MAGHKSNNAARRNRQRYKIEGRKDKNAERKLRQRYKKLYKKFPSWPVNKRQHVAVGGRKPTEAEKLILELIHV